MVMQMMKSAAVLAIAAAGLALAPAGVGMAQTATYRPLVSDTLPVGEIALQNDSRYTLTLVTISVLRRGTSWRPPRFAMHSTWTKKTPTRASATATRCSATAR